MWNNFTEKARKTVAVAQDAAGGLGDNYVSTEHVLLGLLKDEECAGATVLRNSGQDVSALRGEVTKVIARGPGRLDQEISLTPRAKRAFDLAAEEAGILGSRYIGTQHLLLGLMREEEGAAGRILAGRGLDVERVRGLAAATVSDYPLMSPYPLDLFPAPALGGPITVPDSCVGLVVVNDKPCDALGPGQYVLDSSTCPELGRLLGIRPGEQPKKTPKIAVHLFSATATSMTWAARPVISKGAQLGMTYCELNGRVALAVTNPAVFYSQIAGATGRLAKKYKGVAAFSLEDRAKLLVVDSIVAAVGVAFEHHKPTPDQFAGALPVIQQSIGGVTTATLNVLGLYCFGVEITRASGVLRTPCSGCKSKTVPTGYGLFRRNISLIYVRYGAQREGNFCVPCAAKLSASYNLTMLAIGWWGYIGLLLSPVYFAQNCFHFCRIAFGPKAASVGEALPATDGGVWPPGPNAWEVEGTDR